MNAVTNAEDSISTAERLNLLAQIETENEPTVEVTDQELFADIYHGLPVERHDIVGSAMKLLLMRSYANGFESAKRIYGGTLRVDGGAL